MDCWQLRSAMGFYGDNQRRTTSPLDFDKLQSTVNTRLATLALLGRMGHDTARGAT